VQDYAQLQRSVKTLSDTTLNSCLATTVGQDRGTTATMLVYLAEFDERQLYRPAAYPSMHAYCVGELRFSDDMAYKRIHAARAARRCPAIFAAVADGRLHLTAVVMLAAHLTPENAEGLIAAATRKNRFEIERLLAARAPRPDVPAFVRALPAPREVTPESAPKLRQAGQNGPDTAPEPLGCGVQLAARQVGLDGAPIPDGCAAQLAARQVGLNEPDPDGPGVQLAPAQVPAARPPKVTPLAPERFALQVTIGQRTHDKLCRAQELLGHQVASRDLAGVLDRALDALIAQLEKRKFAATAKSRPANPARTSRNPRYVPAHVRRAVRQRDGDRCTFVSATGRRCEARARLEFDHAEEVARGGRASVENVRLRCRAHNHYTAECTFGAGFMREKRRHAAAAREVAKHHASAEDRRALNGT